MMFIAVRRPPRTAISTDLRACNLMPIQQPQPTAQATPTAAPVRFDLFAAFLSYLVPGLGQIYQGRIGKGLLFLIGIYGLFFYGMYLGRWSNVFLADTAEHNPAWKLPRWAANLYNRPHFAGQFWIGAAAWPAIWRYNHDTPDKDRGSIAERDAFVAKFEAAPSERELNELQRDSDKHWDLGWVYTVIAGVLNVLVIYDALSGPALGNAERSDDSKANS
jgi:TM2 domain-containing membrane protein YozV